MITVRIPTPLRSYTDGQSKILVVGSSVKEVLKDLIVQYPALKVHMFTDTEELRPFINIYLRDEDIRYLQGIDTPIKNGETLLIIPSIAGG
jgi:molybdopterin converting factor small subunit